MRGERSVVPARVLEPGECPGAVSDYFAALNGERWSLLEPLWHPDAVLRAPGTRPRTGRSEIMAYFRSLFEPWSSHRDEPTRVLVAEDTVVVEVEFAGVTRSGVKLTFDAVDIFDLRDGIITTLTTWYDLNWLRKQI